MSSADFDTLCDGALAPVLEGLETTRKTAVQRFWMIMGGAGFLAVLALIFLPNFGFKIVAAFLLLLGGWIFASGPLSKAGRSLKDPAIAAIGAARGFTHAAGNFVADGYQAIDPLFGRPTRRTFRDRIAGEDAGGAYVFYEANLSTGQGKSRREVFNGLVFSLARRPVQGETVVTPDRGLFNFFTPGQGMERVKFEEDPDFEKRFEVYSTRPDEARGLLNPVAREQLKAWRTAHGKVIARIAADTTTIAVAGRGDRFEPGSMMKSIPGRERVRGIWNDLEAALAQLQQIRQALG